MIEYFFVLVLNLPSFGGQVVARIEAPSLDACVKVRRVVTQAFGGETNINGSISICQPKDRP